MIFELVSPQCRQAVAKNCLQPTTVSNSMSRNKLEFQTHTNNVIVPQGHSVSLRTRWSGVRISPGAPFFNGCIPVTWFTSYTGDIVNTFSGTKGLGAGSIRPSSLSKNPKSYCMKLTSQIWSATSLMPTVWPPNTVLMLILRLPKQMRPQRVTRAVRS